MVDHPTKTLCQKLGGPPESWWVRTPSTPSECALEEKDNCTLSGPPVEGSITLWCTELNVPYDVCNNVQKRRNTA